ncbi:MAG: carbohydrate-binding domain-containing protein [Bacteroidales bacterium]|jgi:hypothetical protein|nr:carbohydrate-binding domain-containing protein [Bacteroidales bacterium]
MKKTVLRLILLAGLIPACNSPVEESDDDGVPNTETNDRDKDEPFVTNPKDTVFADAVTIAYASGSVSVDNPYEGKGVSVAADGGRVTVKSTLSGTTVNYVLTGVHTDGSFGIYSDADFRVVLNGVHLICSDGPALNIQSRQEATLLLVGETNNRMIDNNIYSDNAEDRKATIFSEGGLNFDGSGKLVLKGYYKHAVCSDDHVTISGGNIEIQSAYKDGVHANDFISVRGGLLSVTATDDGMECEEGNVEISGGNVTLHTTGNASYNTAKADISSSAGLKCSGNFDMTGGTLNVVSDGTAGKGVSADGNITVNGGSLQIATTGKQFRYGQDDSAAKGMKAEGDLTVNGGTIRITTAATEAEGMESKQTLTVNGGIIEIDAYDDAINASSRIVVNGGEIYAYSAVNDGIDSNGTLTVTGGTIVASGAASPEEGIDCDRNTLKITGGTTVAVGGASSAPTASVCTQPVIVYSGSTSAGQIIHIASAGGTAMLTFKLPRNYTRITMLFSAPNLATGAGYSLYTGGSIAGGTDFHGLYSGGDYTQGTLVQSFTVSSMVTSVGDPSPGTGGGNRPR